MPGYLVEPGNGLLSVLDFTDGLSRMQILEALFDNRTTGIDIQSALEEKSGVIYAFHFLTNLAQCDERLEILGVMPDDFLVG